MSDPNMDAADLQVMHRRAQHAEGRVKAALFSLRSWQEIGISDVTAKLALRDVEKELVKFKEPQK